MAAVEYNVWMIISFSYRRGPFWSAKSRKPGKYRARRARGTLRGPVILPVFAHTRVTNTPCPLLPRATC